MATRIRLQRHGRRKAPFYHIVVADITSPRDGKFIERLGIYNPTTIPATIAIDVDKAVSWLNKGAQPTTTVKAILHYKGILYKKHLLRGVSKGAFTLEVAEEKFTEWLKSHENTVMDHVKKIEDTKVQVKAQETAKFTAKREEIAKAAKKLADDAAAEAEKVETVEVVVEEAPVAENIEAITEEVATPDTVSEEPTAENTNDQ